MSDARGEAWFPDSEGNLLIYIPSDKRDGQYIILSKEDQQALAYYILAQPHKCSGDDAPDYAEPFNCGKVGRFDADGGEWG